VCVSACCSSVCLRAGACVSAATRRAMTQELVPLVRDRGRWRESVDALEVYLQMCMPDEACASLEAMRAEERVHLTESHAGAFVGGGLGAEAAPRLWELLWGCAAQDGADWGVMCATAAGVLLRVELCGAWPLGFADTEVLGRLIAARADVSSEETGKSILDEALEREDAAAVGALLAARPASCSSDFWHDRALQLLWRDRSWPVLEAPFARLPRVSRSHLRIVPALSKLPRSELWKAARGMFWHHRILVKKITAGVWIAITPDLELVRHNLLEQRHLVLERNSMFPANRRGEVYGLDPVPRAEILALKKQAAVQAAILGDGDHDVEMENFVWVVAEVGHSRFAQPLVDAELDRASLGQSKGVALVSGLEVFIEKVQSNQLQEWMTSRSSEGGDLRTLGDHRDSAGRRHLPLSDAISLMRETSFDDWAMLGPRVAKEWLVSVRDGPGDLSSYHGQWVRRSGVSESSAVAHIHYVLCESVRLAIQTGQLDVTNLLSFELIMRRICQDETAVARNPRHPDYGGLEILLRAPTAEQGQASTNKFTEWVTGRLKEQAAIYKQTRLWNEEQRAMQNSRAPAEWILDSIAERVAAVGAARELLASKDLYCQEPKKLAPFDLTKLKVAKGRARPRSVANFLPPLPADMIRNPALYIEKDEGEMEFTRQHTDPIRPYWGPVLRSSRTECWRLFRALYELGLITFRRRLRARAALFFVKKKKPGEIRMIVDARLANSCHRAPAISRLGSAGALADLDLSVGGGSVDGVGSVIGWGPRGNEADVEDCFYNFAIDGLTRDTHGINVGAFWDPGLNTMVSVEDDMVLYPCMRAMCMGWSWALYFAQEAVSAMTERALRSSSPPTPAMAKEHRPAPDLNESKVMGSVYVDNITVFDRDASLAREASSALQVMHEMRLVAGLVWLAEVDLAAPYVPHVYAGDSADNGYGLMYKKATVEEMQSAFRWKEKWSFRQHLRGPRVGLTSAADVAEMGGYREADETQLDHEVGPRCRSAEPNAGSAPATAFGQWLQSMAEEGSALDGPHRPRPRRLRRRPADPDDPDAECLGQVGPLAPPLPASWFDSEGFKLVAARRWRWPGEHINVKETRAAVMGLRHACCVRQNCGRRLVSLVDSMVCVGCLDKGRPSRSAALNAQCRRAAAYTIGCRVRWRLRYANTKFNVADGQGFLELFSGEGGLSKAFEELGLSTYPCMDIKDGAHYDLLDPKVQNIILEDIRKGHGPWPRACQRLRGPEAAQTRLTAGTWRPGFAMLRDGRLRAPGSAPDQLGSGFKRSLTSGSLAPSTQPTSRAGLTTCGLSSSSVRTPTSKQQGSRQPARGKARKVAGRRSRVSSFVEAIKGRNLCFGPTAPAPVDGGVARFGSITSTSLERYGTAVRAFFDWATRSDDLRQAPESVIDQKMCKYFDVLMSDARHAAEGRYTLWGYLTFFPRSDIAKSARLSMAREAMKGWVRRFPGSSRHPWPLSVFYLFMSVFLRDKHTEAAVALAIQLDAYLRPSEICELRWCSVVQPSKLSSSLSKNKWAVVIGNSDLGETTKTGESDDTVVLDSVGREWVGSVLEMWARRHKSDTSSDQLVFPHLSLAKYVAWESRCELIVLRPVTLAADTLERKRQKADRPECPGAPRNVKATIEAELATEAGDMQIARQGAENAMASSAVRAFLVDAGMSASSRPTGVDMSQFDDDRDPFGHRHVDMSEISIRASCAAQSWKESDSPCRRHQILEQGAGDQAQPDPNAQLVSLGAWLGNRHLRSFLLRFSEAMWPDVVRSTCLLGVLCLHLSGHDITWGSGDLADLVEHIQEDWR
ncbi:unnamed protein product, partial [Prorocentrum cordatum]